PRTSLLAPEDLRDQFLRGLAVYRERLSVTPETFGCRRFALTATLPAILKNFRIGNALHLALDDGILPKLKQSRIRWRGIGIGAVESLCRLPCAPSDSDAWMRIPEMIGSPYGVDGTPTLVVARWPGQEGWVMEVFRTIHRYAPIFGEFRTISTYFTKTFSSGKLCQTEAREYRSPYVVQAVAAGEVDPVTRWVRHHRRRFLLDTLRSLVTLYLTIFPKHADLRKLRTILETGDVSSPVRRRDATDDSGNPGKRDSIAESCNFNQIFDFSGYFPSFSRETEDRDDDFNGDQKQCETLRELAGLFAGILVATDRRKTVNTTGYEVVGNETEEGKSVTNGTHGNESKTTGNGMTGNKTVGRKGGGILRLNPWSVPVRWRGHSVEPLGLRWLPESSESTDDRPEMVSENQNSPPGRENTTERKCIGKTPDEKTEKSETRRNSRTESESVTLEFDETERIWTLRNDRVHVLVDAVTGEIRSLRSGLRRNRLGLRLAYHAARDAISVGKRSDAAPGDETEYSLCAADRIEILTQSPDVGAIRIHGRLVHRNGTQLASFRWTIRLTRMSPVLDCDVELNPHVLPDDAEPENRNPWLSAYVLQTAWSDASASFSYSANLLRVDAGSCSDGNVQSVDAPFFVHLRTRNTRYTLLCDGLPFHRRYGSRRLDTLLIPAGETERRFRFAISAGSEPPAVAAITRMAESDVLDKLLTVTCETPAQTDAWWYRLEPANVILTGWEPLFDPSTSGETSAGTFGKASPEEVVRTESGPETVPSIVGFTARIMETEGRETHAVLTTYRNVKNAIVTSFTESDPRSLTCKDDEVRITLDPHQWRQLEIRWR
ncbi:MAG: hypothetical protein Q4C47_01255, partial [Planctomycetia bacterium]|nr:hypothetical protein [Planctomycetia bacterium]